MEWESVLYLCGCWEFPQVFVMTPLMGNRNRIKKDMANGPRRGENGSQDIARVWLAMLMEDRNNDFFHKKDIGLV